VIRLSQVIGQRVVTRAGGQLLGSVRRLLLDTASGRITAADLERPAGGSTFIDWSAVMAVGPDALLVDSVDVAREPNEGNEQRLLGGELDLPGKLVLSQHGDALGELEDLEFDEQSGRVVRVHVPGHALSAPLVALGPDALIIATASATSTAASAR
jgi:sporulation protein YlmC with PRC-barrel domain